MNKKRAAVIIVMTVFLLYLLFFHDKGGIIGYMIFAIPKLSLSIDGIDTHLEFSRGCTALFEGTVVNIGQGTAQNVEITCDISDKEDYVLGQNSHSFSTLLGNSRQTFSLRVETECFPAMEGQQYRCAVDCDNC